ncbi:MAG: oligosaccharide flippase family protein [Candidatus Thiodiazotropha sp.]
MTKISKTLSHSSIYLAGSIMQRSVSLIMLPIYTRYLTPTDYGVIELLSLLLDFIGIVLGLRVSQAIFRFYSHYESKRDKNELISTAIILVGLLNVLGYCIIFIGLDFFTNILFGDIDYKHFVALFSLTILGQGFIEIPMTYVRAQQRPWLFVAFSFLKLLLQLSLNIYFIVFLDMHVMGVVLSALITTVVMAILLGGYTFYITGIHLSKDKAKELTLFSVPEVLTGIITFYITFGDRYFLREFYSLHDVGIYSLGYKFGFIFIFLVVQPFQNIWDSEKYNVLKQADAKYHYKEMFIKYNIVIFLVIVGLCVYVKDLLVIMSDKEFWPASKIVPIILAAYVTNAWASYLNFGILLNKKTIEITYATLISAVAITAGYLVLIPLYGGMGAAWAALIAFSIRCIWVYFRAKRMYDMGIEWSSVFILSLVALVAAIASSFTPSHIYTSLFLNTCIFLSYCAFLLLTPQFSKRCKPVLEAILKK